MTKKVTATKNVIKNNPIHKGTGIVKNISGSKTTINSKTIINRPNATNVYQNVPKVHKRLARSQRVGAKRSVIRHKRMKSRLHAKEVAERRAQRKTMRQVNSMRERYNKMNHSVFSGNRTFKRLKPQVEQVFKIKHPNYNQRQHIRAVVRDFNSHDTTSFRGSRKIFRSSVKSIYNLENKRHGNKWKKLLNREISTPSSVHATETFWGAYHKLNDLLESEKGSKDIFDSDTKLSYLSGHASGSSSSIARNTFNDLLQYASPVTGIIL